MSATVTEALRSAIIDSLSASAAIHEYIVSHALDCDATPKDRPVCPSCGSSDPSWPLWVSFDARCNSEWHA